MAINNPFSITFRGTEVGGVSDAYQLRGPYVFDKTYEDLRLVFDVQVVGSTYANLQALSTVIENDFSRRLEAGESFEIDLAGSQWTYTMGDNVLNVEAQVTKGGDPETDHGYTRVYSIAITAQLPASQESGLMNLNVLVDYESSRQRIVTMRGTYTALSGASALSLYQSNFDAEALLYLDAVDSSATFELVDETFDLDRQRDATGDPFPHHCNFSRQYVELLANQSAGQLDDSRIRDHRITFSDASAHAGDSREDIDRLRRVSATFEGAVDAVVGADLKTLIDSTIEPYLVQEFRSEFNPNVFGVEERRESFDPSRSAVSLTISFLYQKSGGSDVIEISQSVAYREERTIDYTPTHAEDELGFDVDPGWLQLERVFTRTAAAIGSVPPSRRLSRRASDSPIGRFTDSISGEEGPDRRDGTTVNADGWNIISNTSESRPVILGDPAFGEQIETTVLTEVVVERFHRKPDPLGGIPTPGGT